MMRFPINASILANRVAFANTRTTTNAVAAAFTTNRLTGTDRLTGFRMMATAPAVKVRTACSIFLA